MIWLTPSSRKAHVVARSAVEAGIGRFERDMVVEAIGERKLIQCHQVKLFICWLLCTLLCTASGGRYESCLVHRAETLHMKLSLFIHLLLP